MTKGRAVSAEHLASQHRHASCHYSHWTKGLQSSLEAMLVNSDVHTSRDVLEVLLDQGTHSYH